MKLLAAAILIATSWLLLAANPSLAQTHLTGEISADVVLYDFSNEVQGDPRTIEVRRSLATQHLELQLSGPLAKSEFAEYVFRTRLAGNYFQVDSESEQASEYINPDFTTLFGSLTLFPKRSYPLRLYAGNTTSYAIRYEANNRSDLDSQKPQLAVVRSYAMESDFWGAQWTHAISEPLSVGFEYKDDKSQILRRYDFDENLDVYADLSTLRIDPTSPTHNVDIINNIPDEDVTVFVDLVLIDVLPGGASGSYVVEAGVHEVEFVPERRRPYRTQVDVQGAMTWRIFFNKPSGPNDLRQNRSGGNATLSYEKTGQVKNRAYVESMDSDEAIQGVKSGLILLQNDFSYELSENAGFGMITTYNGTTSDVQDISSQENKSFVHQTTGRWGKKNGWSTNLMHSFTRAAAQNSAIDLRTNTQLFNLQTLRPARRWNHRLSARANATLLSDTNDFQSDQYTLDVGNSIELRRWGFRWRPKNQSRYTLNKQSNPSSTTSEWESRNYIEGQHDRFPYLHELNLKGEYSWRRREDDVGLDTKQRFLGEIGFARRFGQAYRISAALTKELETFDSSAAPARSSAASPNAGGRPDEARTSYRVDAQFAPWLSLNLGVNAVVIQQNDSSIQRTGFTLISRVPRLNIPLRSFLIMESRKLERVPEQNRAELETQFSYNFRAVRLIFAHAYVAEKLLREEYRFQEIRVDVTRSFALF